MKEKLKNFKFVEKSKIWFGISLALIIISLAALLFRGLNFGIDFAGGTIVTIDLHTTFQTEDVRSITDKYDTGADITFAGDEQQQVVISTKESLTTEQREELFQGFKTKYKLEEKDLLSVDNITPTVGSELTRNTMLACIVAIALMLVYITFRFEFLFGLASVIALIHDVTIVIGVYALFQIQVNSPFIAAILTILGYSINDTIVVFDRIRDNEKLYGLDDIDGLTNRSIAETFTRSINTVATTLVAILALYIFSVDAIRDFALPIIVGILCGCYSSIFVASPLWVFFQKKFGKSRFNQRRQKREAKGKGRRKNTSKDKVQV